MKRSRAVLMGVAILGILCLALGCLGYVAISSLQRKAIESRPLVLIHAPLNREQVSLDRGILIHVTARAEGGVARIELWVDGVLVAARDALADGAAPLLPLSAGWQPSTLGSHVLVARAVSVDEVEGQAAIVVEAVEAAGQAGPVPGAHIVQEGETLEEISAGVGASPEDVEALNPGLGPEGPQPGDVLYTPPEEGVSEEGGGEPAGEETPSTDEPPPDPQASAPGSEEGIVFLFAECFQPPAEPVLLRVEALALETGAAVESLHCYVGIGEGEPRWVPDDDSDPSTDESFAALGGGGWDVEAHLSGDRAAVFTWPGDQPLTVTVTCVGAAGGGTDALEVGRLEIVAPPEVWDGLARRAVSGEGEETFTLEYRIGQVEEEAKYPDPSIASPTNVRIDQEQRYLRWDYEPGEGQLPIDGFCVYLNDTLQWSEPASSRESRLPAEWFRPPCGEEYRFTVAAFRGSCLPEDPQSFPSEAATTFTGEIGDPGCQRAVLVTFETLETGDLGGDGAGRDDPGDVGPVYGTFYVNDQQIRFDGRPIEGDNFPTALGWNHNSRYSFSSLIENYGDGTTQLLVELPPGNPSVEEHPLWIWFEIWDADTGRNNADDEVCSGETALSDSRVATRYSGSIETDLPVDAMPDRCVVRYSVQPVGDVPVVAPGEAPPLPDLRIENMTVDASSGRTRLHVRNVGRATWQTHDLDVAISSLSGEDLGVLTWPNLTLAPGELAVLSHHDLDPDPPLSVCALLDPNNRVEEESDILARNAIWTRGRHCQPMPDLMITLVEYDAETAALLVTVQNVAGLDGGALEHRDISLRIDLADGSTLSDRPVWRNDVTLARYESAVLEWAPISAEQRARMRDGYTVVLDAVDSIAESDEENNMYVVLPTARLRIAWPCGWASFCNSGRYVYGGANTWQMHLVVTVSGGRSNRTVADWESPEIETSWYNTTDSWCNGGATYATDWFEVAGDETLGVWRWSGLDIRGHGYRWFEGGMDVLQAQDDNFGGTTLIPQDTPQECLFQVGCPLTWGGRGGVTCVPITCSGIGDEGQHDSGTLYASGDEIVGTCFWNTTYVVYRAEE